MKSASTLQYCYLAYFSRPAHQRCLYRALRRHSVRSLVELGVNDVRRSLRLLAVAQRFRPGERLSYAGIDLFEARSADRPALKLKDAHCQLTRTGAQVRLVPGDPHAALARCANALTNTDLLVISAEWGAALEPAWFYIPRMLHEGSVVFLEERQANGATRYRRLSPQEIAQRAPGELRRAA